MIFIQVVNPNITIEDEAKKKRQWNIKSLRESWALKVLLIIQEQVEGLVLLKNHQPKFQTRSLGTPIPLVLMDLH